MTNSQTILDSSRTFEESLEILSRELELSAKWRRPAVLVALCESEEVHAEAVLALEQHLADRKEEVVHLHLSEIPQNCVVPTSQLPHAGDDCIHFLNGLKYSNGNDEPYNRLFEYLDFVNDKKIRAVLWLDSNGASKLAHQAPDIWISCQRVVEFDLPSYPVRLPPCSIQEESQQPGGEMSTYQGDETYLFQSEEGVLPPIQFEAPNLAGANLLLKLGLLYWRKGNFLMAGNALESALQTATHLQNGQLQAECYNAIALVNTSMGRYEEAIESYRQVVPFASAQSAPWNQIGNLCLKVQRNDEAIVAFQKTIEHKPKDPIAWIGLGKVYSQIGYMNDAIRAYQKATEFAPSYALPWEELGNLYAALGRAEDAIQSYQKAIQTDPQNTKPRLELARLFKEYKRYPEAVRCYRHALDIAPNDGSLWDELGQTHLMLGDLQTAAFHFARAIKLDPDLGMPYSNLALTYAAVGKYQDAVAFHTRGIELTSNPQEKAEFWCRLADSYRQLGKYNDAMSAYRAADELTRKSHAGDSPSFGEKPPTRPNSDPKDGEPSHLLDENQTTIQTTNSDSPIEFTDSELDRGETPMKFTLPRFTKKTNASEKILKPDTGQRNYFNINSLDANEWNEKGNRHLRDGEYKSAISAYEKAAALDPSFGKPYNNLAFACLMLGRQEEALVHFTKGIEMTNSDQDKALCWNGIGFIYRCRKDYHNAMAAYHKADELDPKNATRRENVAYLHTEPNQQNTQIWMELGDMFFKSENYREAANAYHQASALSPNSGACLSSLASSLMFLRKYREAARYYQRSIPLFQQKKDKADAWNRLGDAYRKLNEHDNAISAYQTALKLTDEPDSLLTRARFSLLSNSRVAA